jgi:hypothetical protein
MPATLFPDLKAMDATTDVAKNPSSATPESDQAQA